MNNKTSFKVPEKEPQKTTTSSQKTSSNRRLKEKSKSVALKEAIKGKHYEEQKLMLKPENDPFRARNQTMSREHAAEKEADKFGKNIATGHQIQSEKITQSKPMVSKQSGSSASEYQSRQQQQQNCVSQTELELARLQGIQLSEIEEIIDYYCDQQQNFVNGLCDTIDKAKEDIQKIGELQDNSFWSDLATTVVTSAVGFIPGGAGLASRLERWGMGKVSSNLIETISSDIAKFLAEKGISSSAGNISDISSNLALSDKAFELRGVLRENYSIERTFLHNIYKDIKEASRHHPEIINDPLLSNFQQLEKNAPHWTRAIGQAFVYHFERILWPTWIQNNCYILEYRSHVWGVYSRNLKGISDKTINYLNNKFGWNKSSIMNMVTRVETQWVSGFGSLDNR